MKIYLHIDKKNSKMGHLIRNSIIEEGFQIIKNDEAQDPRTHEPKPWNAQYELFQSLRGFVLEMTYPNPQTTYLLAQAILQKIPVLGIYQKNNEPREFLSLLKQKKIPNFVCIKSYSRSTISHVLSQFLSILKSDSDKNQSNIKFTLRISPRIEQYLQWIARKQNSTKADYLREIVEDYMKQDNDFQNWIGSEKKKKEK